MKNNSLGDRMKSYEKMVTGAKFMPHLPVVARIDGKSFHTWTKGLNKPFDTDFMEIMKSVTKGLVETTGAVLGYTQSDEISLVFHTEYRDGQIFFDGKIFKMTSVLASMTTALFAQHLYKKWQDILEGWYKEVDDKGQNGEGMWDKGRAAIDKVDLLRNKPPALFDCRVWQMPTKEEVCNYLVWREQDAVRNSIQSAGQAHFSHKELHKKNQNDIQEMLFRYKGINWNDYSDSERRGTYYQRHTEVRKFHASELEKLPPKHSARTNPNLQMFRTDVRELAMDRFTRVVNREDVVFSGEEPLVSGISTLPPETPSIHLLEEGPSIEAKVRAAEELERWYAKVTKFFRDNRKKS